MIPFPNKKYSVIYADPPWSYQDKRCNGNAADHYPTMRIEDICSLPVQDLAADNCVLFLSRRGRDRLRPCRRDLRGRRADHDTTCPVGAGAAARRRRLDGRIF